MFSRAATGILRSSAAQPRLHSHRILLVQHSPSRTATSKSLFTCRRGISSKTESDTDGGASSTAADAKENHEKGDASSSTSNSTSGASTDEAPIPLHQRFLADMSALFETMKSKVSGADGAGAPSSSAAAASGEGGGQGDPSEGAVMVRQPTFWEKHFDQESPFFQRIRGFMGGAGDAAGGVTDRVFGQTEQAEAMSLLRETHPGFHQETFLSHINDELGPEVLSAYLKGDLDMLREATREQAYATLAASVNERKQRQLLMDTRILYMSEPELESIRIIGGLPTVIVAFETHQVYCLRNGTNGAVVEGSEDDIRAFHYLWALQPNEEEPPEEADEASEEAKEAKEKANEEGEEAKGPKPYFEWQVTELAIRGVLETY